MTRSGDGADRSTPAALLARELARDPSRPLLTHYDDDGPERVELSVVTFANWVAKTANLLVDGLGVGPGDRAVLLLPAHWQSAALAVGCWSAGLEVEVGGDPAGAEVVFAGPADLDRARAAGAGEVVGLSLRPMGPPLGAVPPGVSDYALEVPGYGDRFVPTAAAWSLGPTDRVLSTLPYADPDGLLAGLLAPLAAGCAVVLCRHAQPAVLPGRATAERVTATAGVDLPGLRRLV